MISVNHLLFWYKKVTYRIDAVPLKNIVHPTKSFQYDREVHQIDEKLVYSVKKTGQSMILSEGTHYTVSRKTVTDAGTYQIVYTAVEGSGFTGSIRQKVTVSKIDLKEDPNAIIMFDKYAGVPYSKSGAVMPVEVYIWTGEAENPEIYDSYYGDENYVKLVEGVDYKVSYSNNKTVTTSWRHPAKVTVTGIGNYTGSKSRTFTVYEGESQYLRLSAADVFYKGSAGVPKTKLTLYDGDKALTAGTDYQKLYTVTFYYASDTTMANGSIRAAGTKIGIFDVLPAGTEVKAVMRFQLKGNYVDPAYKKYGLTVPMRELETTFRVVLGKLEKVKCEFSYHGNKRYGTDGYFYTGFEVCPRKDSMDITVNGVRLKSSDYRIVSYKNNVKVSDTKNKKYASVTIEGTGNYTGRATINYVIKPITYEPASWDVILEIFGYRKQQEDPKL